MSNKQIAEEILNQVGGSENVSNVQHCMTRLRLTLKDKSIPEMEVLKEIKGVIGVQEVGTQLQIIIGQNVDEVYKEFCKIGKFEIKDVVMEDLDQPKEKLTWKKVFGNILDYVSGSVVPFIPVMIAASMFRVVQVVFGPDLFNLVSVESDLYKLSGFIYDAGFYFIPLYLGYTAATKLKASPVMGIMMAAMLMVPSYESLAMMEGATFSVYGIPARLVTYGQTLVPILLIVWAMSLVEKFFKKYIPKTLSTIFVPFLTVVVMAPLVYCILGPLGSYIGDYVGGGMIALSSVGGAFALVLMAASWEFIVMTGMHLVIIVAGISIMMSAGQESCIFPAACIATWAAYGMALGAMLYFKNKEDKALSLSYFISGIVGGVTEPVLYGIGLKYKRPFIALALGGAIGGLYAALTHVAVYLPGESNFLSILTFIGEDGMNVVHGTIACVLAMLSTAVFTYFIGFKKKAESK